MKILIIGSGGREHALVWKIAQSPRLRELYCAPGNPGMESLAKIVPIAADEVEKLLAFAKERRIDLTVVGPELPLSLGIVDRFESEGLRIFGPRRAAAEIETSKVVSKTLMQRYRIPTAEAEVVALEEAYGRIASLKMPIVLKVEGLAAGKGVVIAQDQKEAKEGLDGFKSMGEAARRIILEQFLEGVEATFFVITDGDQVVPLASAQDHKRVYDGDQGPNTGGMGAISPTPRITPEVESQIMERIIRPALRGLAAEGRPYRGVLYAGLMLTPSGPHVLEFNARWGDPETQAVLPRLKTDWVDVMEAALDHRLDQIELQWREESSVCVVLASEGYPGPYRKGEVISGLDRIDLPETIVFHAGTGRRGEEWITQGGRVLGVTALGKTVSDARQRAYRAVDRISFRGMQYRRDIGASAR
ncbi:MAG: phosphoribosylamine--glycine ligase [Candidatus Manganitrophaceae bacterium]|nr:MAG: phosphoribosylamine--glycine ligase [Candidatus Manganitrophaceae bacterium]